MSKDLRARGFTLRGVDDYLRAHAGHGMVNDDVVDCFQHREVAKLW
jgi:3-methyladenine DNA glycosylase Tag